MSRTRIIELAHIISTSTQAIDSQLSEKGLPTPSFDAELPGELLFGHGGEFETARQAVIEATDELQTLVQGPHEYITSIFHNTFLSLQAILRFSLYDFTGETTFTSLAQRTGQDPLVLKRLLRHAISHRIFHEPRPGVLAHTNISQTLLNPGIRAYLSFTADELWPSAVHTVAALESHPSAQDPSQTGFNAAHGTPRTFMQEMALDAARNQRYVAMLDTFRTKPEFATTSLIEALPWDTYELVVDVGGSTGNVARDIARRHGGVKIVVQDFAAPVAEGMNRKRNLKEGSEEYECEGRIEFMEHDFFDEQPVKGADVYLLRWVLHDWSDTYAMRVLRALVPALKKGARVVLNEMVVPPDHVVGWGTRKFLRMMDLTMLELHNGKERDGEDWAKLFTECDGRFRFEGAKALPGAALGLVEAVWDP